MQEGRFVNVYNPGQFQGKVYELTPWGVIAFVSTGVATIGATVLFIKWRRKKRLALAMAEMSKVPDVGPTLAEAVASSGENGH